MLRRWPLLLTLLVVLACTPAAAANPEQVLRDCAEDGTVDGSYSNTDKRKALRQMPSDLDEYSDCRNEIGASIRRTPKANKTTTAPTAPAPRRQPSAPGAPSSADPRNERPRASEPSRTTPQVTPTPGKPGQQVQRSRPLPNSDLQRTGSRAQPGTGTDSKGWLILVAVLIVGGGAIVSLVWRRSGPNH